MKKRQAKKIIKNVVLFKGWNSNYQPYSIPQQISALAHVGFPSDVIARLLFYKIPIKYRCIDPTRIAGAMMQNKMQPTCAKEYDRYMKRLLNVA